MKVVVTGAAGFIGSQLAAAALDRGDEVLGIDCLTDYYDVGIKNAALAELRTHPRFRFSAADLATDDVRPLVADAETIFHLAAQPGVRLSWDGFDRYVERNVTATQRLLDAVKATGAGRVVYASSSSVYGNTTEYPTPESALPAPHSPYGVTKLAGEHLCCLYAANWGLDVAALRYFTVYGPRQRPDMGMFRFLDALQADRPITVFGDGEQIRDFTYVGDIVAANLAASVADLPPATVMNVAGGSSVTVNELITLIGEVVGTTPAIEPLPAQAGDVRATGASIDRATALLGWAPQVSLRDGVTAQWAWQQELGLRAA